MQKVQKVISRDGEKRIYEGEAEEMGAAALRKAEKFAERGQEEIYLEFEADSKNEGFARMVAAAYAAKLNPTMEELADIRTAVSEAVTNAIIHGYAGQNGVISMRMSTGEHEIFIEIADQGKGMQDVLKAMEPLYTTRPDMERSGMGFAFMEAFMDELEVCSRLKYGTVVRMKKKIAVTAATE